MKQIPANYREAVDYIEELPKFTEKHPLKHTKKYLKKLQNPAENCKVIHVVPRTWLYRFLFLFVLSIFRPYKYIHLTF